jgi:hypothetical protein
MPVKFNHQTYSAIFILAALYNIFFACWLSLFPDALFELIGITQPFADGYTGPLAFSIGIFSLVYILAILKPSWSRYLIVLALLSKLFPLFTVLLFIMLAGWPPGLLILIFFNDIIWWIPLFSFIFQKNKAIGTQ